MKDFMMIFIGADYTDLGLSPEDLQNRITTKQKKIRRRSIAIHRGARFITHTVDVIGNLK